MKNLSILRITISGLLIAVGIAIPAFSPVKIILEPASFTLASHVPIFIAMFISSGMAAAVAFGTTIGFFLGGFPLVVALRAASHILFATLGALYLRRAQKTSSNVLILWVFSFCVALVHALCELIVVSVFYFKGSMGSTYYQRGFLTSVLFLVGLGTVIHSMVDFKIAHIILSTLRKHLNLEELILRIE